MELRVSEEIVVEIFRLEPEQVCLDTVDLVRREELLDRELALTHHLELLLERIYLPAEDLALIHFYFQQCFQPLDLFQLVPLLRFPQTLSEGRGRVLALGRVLAGSLLLLFLVVFGEFLPFIKPIGSSLIRVDRASS